MKSLKICRTTLMSIKNLFPHRTINPILTCLVSALLSSVSLASELHAADHSDHSVTTHNQSTQHQHHADPSHQGHTDEHAMHKKMMNTDAGYTRSTVNYNIPKITLVNMHNEAVSLDEELTPESPILVNFIFTTCTTICPIMSATFSQAQKLLGKEADKIRMVSISIDPEQDTPEKLLAYAQKFSAGKSWHFLTGRRDDILTSLNALNAYRGNKMNHEPVTLLRASAKGEWIRLEGLTSAEELVNEYRKSLVQL